MECAVLSEHRLHCESDQVNPKSITVAELRFCMKAGCMLETITSTHNDLVFILQFFVIVVRIKFQTRNVLYTSTQGGINIKFCVFTHPVQ